MKFCSQCGSDRLELRVPDGDNLPRHVCAGCGRVEDEEGGWHPMHRYLEDRLGLKIGLDRRFLDNLTRRTIEIANGKAAEYKGNYSYYLKEREIRLEMLRASYENQQEQIRATMAFVDRFRYQATKARQVQSRLKQLDKIERIEMDDEQGSISFDFPPPPSPGRILMKLEGVTKAYGPEPVFSDLNLTLERGDQVGHA